MIQNLAKDRLGNLVKKVKEAYAELCEKQEKNLKDPSRQTMEAENIAYKRWEFVASLEEKYLKQKSKIHWLGIGDENNKMFHRAVTTREAQNSIREIISHEGNVVKDGPEIKTEAEKIFRQFLQ